MVSNERIAGTIILVASIGFVLALNVAEFIYGPTYSVSQNTISDLGATCRSGICVIPKSAALFDTAVFLKGAATVVVSYFFYRAYHRRIFSGSLLLSGIGAIGVGIFPETFGIVHTIFSLLTFTFGGLAALAAYPIEKNPLNYISVFLGIYSLVGLTIGVPGLFNYLGIGVGGMERMVVYPLVLWAIAFGGQLLGNEERSIERSRS